MRCRWAEEVCTCLGDYMCLCWVGAILACCAPPPRPVDYEKYAAGEGAGSLEGDGGGAGAGQ